MLTIGRLAKATGISKDTIRFYERVRLLAPASRTDMGYRLYTEADVRRLAFIKHARLCGFSLELIRELLQPAQGANARACPAYRAAIAEKAPLDRKIEALRAMSEALAAFIAKCDAGEVQSVVAPEDVLSGALTQISDTVPWPEERWPAIARANSWSGRPDRPNAHARAHTHARESVRPSSLDRAEARTGRAVTEAT